MEDRNRDWKHLAIRPKTFKFLRKLKKENNCRSDDAIIKILIINHIEKIREEKENANS